MYKEFYETFRFQEHFLGDQKRQVGQYNYYDFAEKRALSFPL